MLRVSVCTIPRLFSGSRRTETYADSARSRNGYWHTWQTLFPGRPQYLRDTAAPGRPALKLSADDNRDFAVVAQEDISDLCQGSFYHAGYRFYYTYRTIGCQERTDSFLARLRLRPGDTEIFLKKGLDFDAVS